MLTKKSSLFILMVILFYSITGANCSEYKVKETSFVMKEVFDVIKSGNRNTLLDLYPELYREDEIADAYADWDISEGSRPEEAYIHWYSSETVFYFLGLEIKYESDKAMRIKQMTNRYLLWNTGNETLTVTCEQYFMTISSLSHEKGAVYFNIKSMKRGDRYGFYRNEFNVKEIDFNEWDYNVYNAKMIFDGDYVDFYINDNFIHKFCRTTDETLNQYGNLIHTNTCDLSRVTWPRHADGTSEYDDKIIVPEPIKLFEDEAKTEEITNTQVPGQQTTVIREKTVEQIPEPRTITVKKNNVMVLSEDAVVRFDPYSEGTFMTSVVKGAAVKIKKVGKKETINGVTSNWVLINFVGDAYNTKGKKIYYKTEGWLFGGCLE